MIELTAPENLGFSSERLNRINTVMKQYVDDVKYSGFITLVARKGKVVHLEKCGYQDVVSNKPLKFDTIFRIYSMTKPIVSVALMMLYEQTKFQLFDPVSKFLPAFGNVKVMKEDGELIEPKSEMTIHQLLTHTAGLTYGFYETPWDKLYQEANLWEPGIDLVEMMRRIAALPLQYHPGEHWEYSVATDIIGRLIEVIANETLDKYLEERIFKPLGMVDTAFFVPPEKADRFASLYGQTEKSDFEQIELEDYFNVTQFSGGGGLVSTVEDYLQFAKFVLNKGELNNIRLLGRKTMEFMTTNHLALSLLPLKIEEVIPGIGFGLGFSVVMDVAISEVLGSVGLHGWAGMASTYFWVDPVEEIIAMVLTQFVPTDLHPMSSDFRTLVYQALID